MNDNLCEICDYKDTSKLQTVVHTDIDNVRRCEFCRHKVRYGRYVNDVVEELRLINANQYTDYWKETLEKYGKKTRVRR